MIIRFSILTLFLLTNIPKSEASILSCFKKITAWIGHEGSEKIPIISLYGKFDVSLPGSELLPKDQAKPIQKIASNFDKNMGRLRASEIDPPSNVSYPMRAHEPRNGTSRAVATTKKLTPATIEEAKSLGFDAKSIELKNGMLIVDYSSGSISGTGIVEEGTKHTGMRNFPSAYRVGDFRPGEGPAAGYQLVMLRRAPDMGGAWGSRYSDYRTYALVKATPDEVKAAEDEFAVEARSSLVPQNNSGYEAHTKMKRMYELFYSQDGYVPKEAPSEQQFNQFAFTSGMLNANHLFSWPYLADLNTLYISPRDTAKKTYTVVFRSNNSVDPVEFIKSQLNSKKLKTVVEVRKEVVVNASYKPTDVSIYEYEISVE